MPTSDAPSAHGSAPTTAAPPRPGAPQEVQDREQRDRDDREMRRGAVQLGEVRHRRSIPSGGSRNGKGERPLSAGAVGPPR